MKIGAPKESARGEARVALTPESAKQIQKLGHECLVETGAGLAAGFNDDTYRDAGVTVVDGADALWNDAEVVIKVREPSDEEAERLREGQTLIAFFWPAQNEALLEKCKSQGATVIAMDMVPRISRAQKMDALSSMANIAGVAGLAAIGTATSLGAVVRAFDVRPEVSEQIESMGAEFLFLDFEDSQDGSESGGYASPSSPEFREKQLECFREQAADVDIVITTALIPGKPAPKLWLEDMVEAMKPGSVVIDLAAEKGGNCDLTKPDERVVSDNGVVVIGYTDFPSRMATQSSLLYATNIRHMLTDLTPEKDGVINHNMEDDVIRGATVTHQGEVTFPPPPPKVKAIGAAKPKKKEKEPTPEEKKAAEHAAFKAQTKRQIGLLAVGGALMLLLGQVAPTSFMQHFIVFVLACFIGFQVIWNVSHSLHTPLMAVTNAISGIIILGAILQIGTSSVIVGILAAISVLIASINIVGGFLVTRRMLAMFQKS